MLVPKTVDAAFFAPCGMNCMICYKHLSKNSCSGCLMGEENKPVHCRSCKIVACVQTRGIHRCFECSDFPCKQIKSLDYSYKTRYGVSLVQFGLCAKNTGIAAFLGEQMIRYTCIECGGVISLHDGICSQCTKCYPQGKRSVVK